MVVLPLISCTYGVNVNSLEGNDDKAKVNVGKLNVPDVYKLDELYINEEADVNEMVLQQAVVNANRLLAKSVTVLVAPDKDHTPQVTL